MILFFVVTMALVFSINRLQTSRTRVMLYFCKDEDFAKWAFGGDMWNEFMTYDMDTIDLMKAWNERHGNELILKEDDLILDTMGKMKQIFERKE